MSVPLDGATPLIVDLDIFSICGEEAGTVSSMDNSYEELRFEGNFFGGGLSIVPLLLDKDIKSRISICPRLKEENLNEFNGLVRFDFGAILIDF